MIVVNIEKAKQIAIEKWGEKITPEIVSKIMACSNIEQVKLCCP
jgi:hypothetical protein